MSDRDEFEQLWTSYIEGELDEAGIEKLQAILSADKDLLSTAVDEYQIHRLLCANATSDQASRDAFVRSTMEKLPADREQLVGDVMQRILPNIFENRSGLRMLRRAAVILLSVAAGVLLLAVYTSVTDRSNANVAKITSKSGPLSWTGDGGRVVDDLAAETPLSGGTLEVLLPDSWAKLEFRDGSVVTLAGGSLVTFSDLGQKRLHLRRGSFSANVVPQKSGHPMLVHTRSATLEILGTQFKVESELDTTLLNVNEGLVGVKRLSDGKRVEVPANHRVVASADRQLEPVLSPKSVNYWKSQLNLGAQNTHGRWLPASDLLEARLRAIPYVYVLPKRKPITLYLAAMPISQGENPPVTFQSDSRFRVRGSLESSSGLYFGFSVNLAGGGFAGKFVGHIPAENITDSGEFTFSMGLKDFQLDPALVKLKKVLPQSPEGLIVSHCWCVSEKPAGLEVVEVELSQPDALP